MFRFAPTVVVQGAAGYLQGRGVISALRQEGTETGSLQHPLGQLSRPMYHFVGQLPSGVAVGDKLKQKEHCYRVLEVQMVQLWNSTVCTRLLLERSENDECNPEIR